jgi:hypothetical protein
MIALTLSAICEFAIIFDLKVYKKDMQSKSNKAFRTNLPISN